MSKAKMKIKISGEPKAVKKALRSLSEQPDERILRDADFRIRNKKD